MARTKSAVAKNIRNTITGKGDSFSGEDLASFAKLNVSVGQSVTNIAAHIEKLSDDETKFFRELIDEVKKIPQSAAEFEKQQQQIYQNLIKTSAILRNVIEKETDDTKKQNLQQSLQTLEQRGKDIEKELPRGPRTFKERLAHKQFGADPREIQEKGFFGTLFAQSKRELSGKQNPSFEQLVQAEQDVSKIKPIKEPKKTVKEKTRDNLQGLASLSRNIKSLLSEVTVIRKVVEGRIKFDPRSKGNQYYELGPDGKKKSITSESLRTAGKGLFTKEELGKKLGLKPSQIKKKKVSQLEEMAAEDQVVDLTKKKKRSPEKSEETTFEEKNENVERSTTLEKASEQKFTGSGSDTISEGQIEKEKQAQAQAKPQRNTSGGGILNTVLSTVASGGLGLVKKGVGKLFGKGGAKAGVKAAEKAGVKSAEKIAARAVSKKVGAKILAKGLGKSVLKKIPLVGLAAGIGFGVSRLMKGDIAGAVGEVASGAASTIPGLGTAASVAIDAGLAARDIKNESEAATSVDASLGVDPKQVVDTSDVSQMTAQAQSAGKLAQTKVQAAKNQAGAVIENKQNAVLQQPMSQQPVTNITNNTYNTQTGGGKDSSTYNMPPIRSPEISFIRYQDKRMTRVL